MSSDDAGEASEDRDRTSRGEWALGVLGGLVAAALLVFLGHQALARDVALQLDVVVTEVRRTSGEFVVTLRVENSGGTTVEAVHVAGEVLEDGLTVASSSATVSYPHVDG